MRIYIHIPFCDSKCGYCAFFSKINIDESVHIAYMDAILKDLDSKINLIDKIDSIFIGGGTPNIVDSKLYIKLFEKLHPKMTHDCEVSIESNPNLLNHTWLENLKSLGANRLSLGVQSFFSDKLALLQREHNFKDIINALKSARKLMEYLNIDLIYDTILDTPYRLKKEISYALNLGANHISAYALSIDENSKFAKYKSNSSHLLNKESSSHYLKDLLLSYNAKWYEVSNFGINHKCKHNLGYWSYDDYLGLGAGSVGKVDDKRYYAPLNIDLYIKNPYFRNIDILKNKDINFEKIFLGFRSEIGVDIAILDSKKLDILVDENIVCVKDNRAFARDYFLADEIATWIY